MHIFPPEIQHVTEKFQSVAICTENNFLLDVIFLFCVEHSPKIHDVQAHSVSQRDALWACRSAISGEESCVDWKITHQVQYKSGLVD